MKEVELKILVALDEDKEQELTNQGYKQKDILEVIRGNFNSARVEGGLVQDFQVTDVEVNVK